MILFLGLFSNICDIDYWIKKDFFSLPNILILIVKEILLVENTKTKQTMILLVYTTYINNIVSLLHNDMLCIVDTPIYKVIKHINTLTTWGQNLLI